MYEAGRGERYMAPDLRRSEDHPKAWLLETSLVKEVAFSPLKGYRERWSSQQPRQRDYVILT